MYGGSPFVQARTKRRLRRPDQPDPRPDPNPNPNPNPLITTDSTTAPPPQKKAVFFDERFMGARHEEGIAIMKTNILLQHFLLLIAKDYRTMPSGWLGAAPCFRR